MKARCLFALWVGVIMPGLTFHLAAGGIVEENKLRPDHQPGDKRLSQLQVADQKAVTFAANEYRIQFIGDSITRHGFNKDTIKRLKWDHLAGMAASSEDKDFVHLFAAKVQETMPEKKVKIHFKGRGGGVFQGLGDH